MDGLTCTEDEIWIWSASSCKIETSVMMMMKNNSDNNLKMRCVSWQCAEVKNDIIRRIRKADFQTHGIKVTVQYMCFAQTFALQHLLSNNQPLLLLFFLYCRLTS